MNKTEFYADLNRDFKALMAGETSFLATLANTSALLFERLSDVNWAGFYLLEGETLVLGPFQGKLACVRIPVGRGVCGTAVAENQVQRVEDVHAFDGHIACDAASNSEIVLPLVVKIRLLAFWTSTVRSSVALQSRTNRGCASWWRIWKTFLQQPIIKILCERRRIING
ncbi:GAF domain-containing protein [Enterobacter cloacae]|uniref:GAF domain-containing protein n=1 Tax=Enterobacter cloacae TaxID=550 RepID=A0A377M077_ENTCL|nr:GAF domain-containing protein [Enterobacter cloacae]